MSGPSDTLNRSHGLVVISGALTTVDAPNSVAVRGTIVRGINDLNQMVVEGAATYLATVTP